MTLISIIIATGAILLLPHLALVDLARVGATAKFRFSMLSMTLAVAVGAIAMTIGTINSDLPAHVQMILVVLGGILSLSAWIDRISAWAPDALMLPHCVFMVFVSHWLGGPISLEGPAGAAIAVSLGACLFLAAIILWMLQIAIERRFIPPADIIAIISPFILFGVSEVSFAVFVTTSILLLLALKSRLVAQIFSRADAVRDAVEDVAFRNENAVTFLSVMFPVVLCAIFYVAARSMFF